LLNQRSWRPKKFGNKTSGGKMANTKKILTVQNLTEKFNQTKGLILTDYSGLKVDQINKLRKEIKNSGGEFEVIKNTLFLLAAKKSNFLQGDFTLEGPTAVLWLYNQDFSPLKTLKNFIKQTELPKIKFGFWDKQEIDEQKINELASLPGIDQLRRQLLASFLSPNLKLVNVLSGNLKKLILILAALKDKKN